MQKEYFIFRLIKNLSITKKMVSISLIFILSLIVLTIASTFTINFITGAKAFIGGEGMYSKGQKDAVWYLMKYLMTNDESEYKHFRDSMKIPLAGRRARLELEKPDVNQELAIQALIEARNHPDDAKSIIYLFNRLWNSNKKSKRNEIISLWRQCDKSNIELKKLGDNLHGVILKEQNNNKNKLFFMMEIDRINKKIMLTEDAFSVNVGILARYAKTALLYLIVIIFLSSLTLGGFLIFLISNDVRKKILLLQSGIERIAMGNHNIKNIEIEINSADELGMLTTSFIKMANNLLKVQNSLEEKNQELLNAQKNIIKSRNAALEASRLKSEFLANMSHEIRTPMNGVIGMTNLLLDTELNAEQWEFAETIKTSGESLMVIINDILDFSKIEAGKLDLENIVFNLRVTIDEMASLIAVKAHEKSLEYIFIIDSDIPSFLRGDPGRVRQILTNFTGNAIKFTEKGEVLLRVSLENESATHATIRFTVSDTGIGIPKERMNKLFKSFSQVDGSTTRKYGGTGLGLAISKQLSERMNGQIGVESIEGKGSEFWFTAVFEKQSKKEGGKKNIPGSINGKRILIVDDNATNRYVLKKQLEQWECHYGEASDGVLALEELHRAVAEKTPYDFAIIDMQMPKMSGDLLGEKIKQDINLKDTIMIMMASVGKRGDAMWLKKIGFAAYLNKPVKQSQLYDCFATLAGMPKNIREPAAIITRHSLAETQQKKIRILVVDDNKINQMVAIKFLGKFGQSADVADNGKEALNIMAKIPYDIIFMDCQMPVMNGYKATMAIRDSSSKVLNHKVPVIAMTANALQGDRDKCLNAGMDDYLTKPINPQKLSSMLKKWAL